MSPPIVSFHTEHNHIRKSEFNPQITQKVNKYITQKKRYMYNRDKK